MYTLRVLFAFSLFFEAAAFRKAVASEMSSSTVVKGKTFAKKVCKVSEKEAIYGITFSVALADTCSNIKNCNVYNIHESGSEVADKHKSLAEHFIDQPTKTPQAGHFGRCKCPIKSIQSGESRALPDAKSQRTLVEFVATKDEPCDSTRCWMKYNQFLYLTAKNSGQAVGAKSNMWDVGCVEEKATVVELKTVQEIREAAPPAQQLDMSVYNNAGIFPDVAGEDEEAFVQDEEGVLQNEEAVVQEGEVQDLEATKPKEETEWGEFKSAKPQDHKKANNRIQAYWQRAKNKIKTSKEIEESLALFEAIQNKLAAMLTQAAECSKEATKLMLTHQKASSGAVSHDYCDVLDVNIFALMKVLASNVMHISAFKAATMMRNLDSQALEHYLQHIKKAMDDQVRFHDDLQTIQHKLNTVIDSFTEAHMSLQAIVDTADGIMDGIGKFKKDMSQSHLVMESAVKALGLEVAQ